MLYILFFLLSLGDDTVLKSKQQASLTLQLLKKLEITPQPLFRQQSVPIEPVTLFQKMGVGQLDLYILSPCKNSQEFMTFMQKWPNTGSSASKTQTLPLTALTSVSALLVWHPACSQEKVVRVLFAGVTPQTNLIQGLERLKGLTFLQKHTVTTGDLERLGEDKKAMRTDSQDSGRSQVQEPIPKHARDRTDKDKDKGKELLMKENRRSMNELSSKDAERTRIKEMGGKQKAAASEKKTTKKGGVKDGKKEENNLGKSVPPKPRNENKTKIKKEAKNDSKTGAKKPRKVSGKDENNRKKAHASTELTNNDSTKQEKISESLMAQKQRQTPETEHQENPCASKVSTPEDMTADFLRLREETITAEQTELGGKNYTDNCTLCTDQKADVNPTNSSVDQSINCKKQAKVVGFPLALNSDLRDESSVQHDTTPTEFTLLDGALKYSPSSRPSPENQVPGSPEEETVEPDSPDSRPNSAGHTPYCLSPDDVWCKRANFSRIQAQMVNLESDINLPNELCKQSEGQSNQAKNREKHLSFLSLGSLKDGSSDPSPSVATTTTTHSMPAEVSSPQSTEVDESLSMSLEQGPTTVSQRDGDDVLHQSTSNGVHFVGMSLPVRRSSRALGQSLETMRPLPPSALHFEASPHDVDLCLVSPCEFKHFKPADTSESSKAIFAPHHHGINNNNPKDMSPSESNIPMCVEDCPSTTVDGALDSDDEESCSEPSNSPHDLHASQALPQDPPPAPYRDSPPLPPHPDVSMPVPQSDSADHGQRAKTRGVQGKKLTLVSRGKKCTRMFW